MKKTLRYWWLLVIVLVVGPPMLVLTAIPQGDGWVTEVYWIRAFDIGRSSEDIMGCMEIRELRLGFLRISSTRVYRTCV